MANGQWRGRNAPRVRLLVLQRVGSWFPARWLLLLSEPGSAPGPKEALMPTVRSDRADKRKGTRTRPNQQVFTNLIALVISNHRYLVHSSCYDVTIDLMET